jgi:V8-like Glu-specific endopeptidase
MFYGIDTMPGQSGCPVYEDQNNTRVVAIHKGSIATNKKFNIGVVITK